MENEVNRIWQRNLINEDSYTDYLERGFSPDYVGRILGEDVGKWYANWLKAGNYDAI